MFAKIPVWGKRGDRGSASAGRQQRGVRDWDFGEIRVRGRALASQRAALGRFWSIGTREKGLFSRFLASERRCAPKKHYLKVVISPGVRQNPSLGVPRPLPEQLVLTAARLAARGQECPNSELPAPSEGLTHRKQHSNTIKTSPNITQHPLTTIPADPRRFPALTGSKSWIFIEIHQKRLFAEGGSGQQ